jgi:asparagine synthase (glutamine-hydrolysing)
MPLRKDFFTGFGDEVDRTVFITDGVWGTGGAHEIYFHRFARELSRFRLTGNYGSEVFRGISTFKPIGLRPEIFQPTYAAAAAAAASQLDGHRTKHPGTFAIFKEVPWNLFGSVAAGRSQLTFRTPFLDNALVKLAYQAPPHLRRSSMPAARLIAANDRALNAIPTDRGYFGKNSGPLFLWRRAWAEVTFKMDYHYSEGLPKKLFRLNAPFRFFMAQTGLGGCHKFLPYSTWFRRELQPMLRERLAAAAARLGGYFDARQLDGMAAQHASGRVNLTPEINAVLNLESIERQLFKNLPGGNAPD